MLHPKAQTATLTYDDLIFGYHNRTCGALVLRRHYRSAVNWALVLGVGLFFVNLFAVTLCVYVCATNPRANDPITFETGVTRRPASPTEGVPPVVTSIAQPTVRQPRPVGPESSANWPAALAELTPAVAIHPVTEGETITEVIPAPEVHGPTRVENCGVEPQPESFDALDTLPITECESAQPIFGDLLYQELDETVYTVVEKAPEFPGGFRAMRDYLIRNVEYPKPAAKEKISGKVYTSFVVETDGRLTNIQILKGLGFGCDEEAVRVVKAMPRWQPGKQTGRPLRVRYNLPVLFGETYPERDRY